MVDSTNDAEPLRITNPLKVKAGRRGGPAGAAVRSDRRAAFNELRAALDSLADTPGKRALGQATLTAYVGILRGQNLTGAYPTDIRGLSALISTFEGLLERLGGLPKVPTSQTSPVEARSQIAGASAGFQKPDDCACANDTMCQPCERAWAEYRAARKAAP